MKTGIHPEYMTSKITCACGRITETRATVEEIHVEICSHCHPFYTGRQKLVDTAGRVERFRRKYGTDDATEEADEATSDAGETEASGAEDADAEPADDAPTPVAAAAGEADESDTDED